MDRNAMIEWLRENTTREQWGDNRQLHAGLGWMFSDSNTLHDCYHRSVLRVLDLTTDSNVDYIFFENVFEQPVFIDGAEYWLKDSSGHGEPTRVRYVVGTNTFYEVGRPFGFSAPASDFGKHFTVELVQQAGRASRPQPIKPVPLYDRVVKVLGDREVPIGGEDHLVGQVKVDHLKAVLLDKVVKEFKIPAGGDIIQWLHNRTKTQKQPESVFFELANYLGFSGEFNEKEVFTKALSQLKEQAVIVGRVGKLNEFCQEYGVGHWGDSAIDSVIDYIKIKSCEDDLEPTVDRTKPRNKYDRQIVPGVHVDVYDVLGAFTTDSAAVDHAVKKLLAPGQRGHKDRITDLEEAVSSIQREIERLGEWSTEDDNQ